MFKVQQRWLAKRSRSKLECGSMDGECDCIELNNQFVFSFLITLLHVFSKWLCSYRVPYSVTIFLCNTKCTQEHDENWFLAMIFNLFRCIFVIWIECPSNLVYRFLCFIHDCVLLDRWQQAGNSPASFFLIKIYFVSLYFVTPCYFFYSFDMVHFGHANAIRQVMYTSLSLSLSVMKFNILYSDILSC